MDLKNIHESKIVRDIIIVIGILIIVLSILFVGINIGEHRARFAGQFGDNFERNFVGPRGGMMPGGHGAVGSILSISLPTMIINGPDNLEKTILISTSTLIREFQQNIRGSDLKIGDSIIVIGNPNGNGQIEAELIRIMPK